MSVDAESWFENTKLEAQVRKMLWPGEQVIWTCEGRRTRFHRGIDTILIGCFLSFVVLPFVVFEWPGDTVVAQVWLLVVGGLMLLSGIWFEYRKNRFAYALTNRRIIFLNTFPVSITFSVPADSIEVVTTPAPSNAETGNINLFAGGVSVSYQKLALRDLGFGAGFFSGIMEDVPDHQHVMGLIRQHLLHKRDV